MAKCGRGTDFSAKKDGEVMDYCEEHSGQKTLLRTLLGLVGTAVVLLLFVVGLTLNMKSELSTAMANGNKELQDDLAKMSSELQRDIGAVRERVAVLEYQARDKQRQTLR